MTDLLGAALIATLVLLVVVWLGPRAFLWVANWYMRRVIKMLNDFEQRRQLRNAEMRTALDALQRHMNQRRSEK